MLRTYENCLLWTFDTAVWIEHLDEEKGAATHVFDPIASQDYLIPCGNDGYLSIGILLHDNTVYLSTDHHVLSYAVQTGLLSEIFCCEKTRCPVMSCIGDNLYIYAEKEHLLIKYDTVNSGIASQYNIPGSLPKGYKPIVVANCKFVYYPLDDIIYIYDFETSTTDTIRIRTIE